MMSHWENAMIWKHTWTGVKVPPTTVTLSRWVHRPITEHRALLFSRWVQKRISIWLFWTNKTTMSDVPLQDDLLTDIDLLLPSYGCWWNLYSDWGVFLNHHVLLLTTHFHQTSFTAFSLDKDNRTLHTVDYQTLDHSIELSHRPLNKCVPFT